jgi:hypothetical protein
MAYVIKDENTVELLRQLARAKRKTVADAIREAAAHEMERETQRIPLMDRLRPYHEKHGFSEPQPGPDWTDVKRQSDADWEDA